MNQHNPIQPPTADAVVASIHAQVKAIAAEFAPRHMNPALQPHEELLAYHRLVRAVVKRLLPSMTDDLALLFEVHDAIEDGEPGDAEGALDTLWGDLTKRIEDCQPDPRDARCDHLCDLAREGV